MRWNMYVRYLLSVGVVTSSVINLNMILTYILPHTRDSQCLSYDVIQHMVFVAYILSPITELQFQQVSSTSCVKFGPYYFLIF